MSNKTIKKTSKRSKYRSNFHPARAAAMVLAGKTNREIAKKFNVSEKTLYSWANKYPHFQQALRRQREILDSEIENSSLRRASGFRYTEMTITDLIDVQGQKVGEKFVIRHREAAPDLRAIMRWLAVRQPQEWGRKPQDDSDDPLAYRD